MTHTLKSKSGFIVFKVTTDDGNITVDILERGVYYAMVNKTLHDREKFNEVLEKTRYLPSRYAEEFAKINNDRDREVFTMDAFVKDWCMQIFRNNVGLRYIIN